MVVVWSKRAAAELLQAYKYIYRDSPRNAITARDTIINMTVLLSRNPDIYPPDKYKKDNDGSWRAFEKYRYGISYRILKNEIRIVRMRHTSRSPLSY